MKKVIGTLALLVLGFKLVMSQAIPMGNPTLPGIVKAAETAKTYVYQIKLKGSLNEEQARLLDSNMLMKRGILSSRTTVATRVCAVEVLKAITENHLRQIVQYAGLEVSKTFTE